MTENSVYHAEKAAENIQIAKKLIEGGTVTGMDVPGDGIRIDTPQGFILFRYSRTLF